jgi:HD-GYP domain-containing protein (c-di-GMP phosphodiesterase class II)
LLKKIDTRNLKVGMVVERMDRPWLEHPFLTSRKKITSASQINKLLEYSIDEVYINPDLGLDFEPLDAPVPEPDFPESETDFEQPGLELQTDHAPPPSDATASPRPSWAPVSIDDPVSFEEEIKVARLVQREARFVVNDVMHDIRIGKNIEGGKVSKVVENMVASIFRNRDALTSLTRIKGYDEYTFVHSVNVCALCLTLGRHLGLDPEQLRNLGIGAMLHDTGKMKVPIAILNKPGRLTEREFTEMKKHPIYSAEIMSGTDGIPEEAKSIALQHHERFHGNGYPFGLRGDEIRMFSQLTSIIDVYDAITSNRCYSKALPAYEGIKKLYEWGRTDFNLPFVERFIQCLGIYPVGTVVQLDSSEIGVVLSINHEMILRPNVLLIYKDEHRRYPSPVNADLTLRKEDGKRFARTIVRPLNPDQWRIDVEQILAKVG